MPEYRRHAFEKDWHDKVEDFIEKNNLAFDSPKYFIKFCVNRYMEKHEFNESERKELSKDVMELLTQKLEDNAESLADDPE